MSFKKRSGEKSVIEPELFKTYGLISVIVTCRDINCMMEFAMITGNEQNYRMLNCTQH